MTIYTVMSEYGTETASGYEEFAEVEDRMALAMATKARTSGKETWMVTRLDGCDPVRWIFCPDGSHRVEKA